MKLIPSMHKFIWNIAVYSGIHDSFFWNFRISELIRQSKQAQGFRRGLLISDLQFSTEDLKIQLVGSKTDQLEKEKP